MQKTNSHNATNSRDKSDSLFAYLLEVGVDKSTPTSSNQLIFAAFKDHFHGHIQKFNFIHVRYCSLKNTAF